MLVYRKLALTTGLVCLPTTLTLTLSHSRGLGESDWRCVRVGCGSIYGSPLTGFQKAGPGTARWGQRALPRITITITIKSNT